MSPKPLYLKPRGAVEPVLWEEIAVDAPGLGPQTSLDEAQFVALDIDRGLNGVPLAPPNLYVIDDSAPRRRIVATPRIGIYNSGDWQERPLRFCWDSPHLSRPIPKKPRAS